MKARSLPILVSLLGAAALAGLASILACTPVVRDFGSGGSGGGSTGITASSGSTGGGGGGSCTPGDKAECYGGPDGTKGVGICKAGVKICNAKGDGYEPCMGEVQPKAEDCATTDDEDCDGKTDPCPLTNLWANAPGTAGGDNVAHAVAVDDQGFIYVTGTIDGSAAFDASAAGQVTSMGSDDIYVAKYAPNGTFLWVNAYGDMGSQTATSIAVGKNGNVYVGGYYSSKVAFGPAFPFLSQGGEDAFLLALNPDGATIVALTAGDASDQRVTSLALSPTGDIVVGGTFSGTFGFPGGPQIAAEGGSPKIFLARFTPALAFEGMAASSGAGSHELSSLAVGPDGSVAFAGKFSGAFGFLGAPLLSAVDQDDIVLGQVDSLMTMSSAIWTHGYNGGPQDYGAGVAIDSKGSVLLGGYFSKTTMIGNIPLSATADASLFLAKLSPMGDALWAHTYGDAFPGLTLPLSLRFSASDQVVAGGCFYGKADFGGGPLVSPGALMDFGAIDAFLAELDGDGKYIAAKSFGNLSIQAGLGLSLGPKGDVVYCGATGGSLDFGTGPVGPADINVISPFLAKFTP